LFSKRRSNKLSDFRELELSDFMLGLGFFRNFPERCLVPLKYYCDSTGFVDWTRLEKWYASFDADPHLDLIRRNLDRECECSEIDEVRFQIFLTHVANQADDLAPCHCIKAAIKAHWDELLLPGLDVEPRGAFLYRYMLLEDFFEYNAKHLGPVLNWERAAEMINSGQIDGTVMEGSALGLSDRPIWCTDESLQNQSDGDIVRNTLGLKHMEGGYIIEIAYPLEFVRKYARNLQAPTFLDACRVDPRNWIFVKRPPGAVAGATWGRTVVLTDDGAGAPGVPEVVHASFEIRVGEGSQVALRVLGPLKQSAPAMNFSAMLTNPSL
jgi:hypothetical protein